MSFFGGIRQPLDDIFSPRNTHNGHTGDFPHPPLQIPVVGRNDIDFMLHDAIDEAIIRIDTLVVALQPLPAFIPRDAQGDPILGAELFELGHDAVGDDGNALGIQTVHHGRLEFEFVLHGVGEEIGVDEDGVGRDECRVVLVEEGGGDLRDFADELVVSGLSFGFGLLLELVLLARVGELAGWILKFGSACRSLQAGVAMADDSFHLRELSSTLLDAHAGLRWIGWGFLNEGLCRACIFENPRSII